MMLLDRIVRAAGASLAESLNYYWPPANGDAMALERNISLHMAHAFRSAGQLVYGEVNPAGVPSKQVDLLAIDTVNQRFTIAEFKRLQSRTAVESMLADWAALQTFNLQPAANQHQLLGGPSMQRWVLIAGLTSLPDLARWFNTYDPNQWDPWSTPAADGPLDAIWAQDWAARFNAGMLYLDAVPLADWHEVGNARHTHWLVYVFAKV